MNFITKIILENKVSVGIGGVLLVLTMSISFGIPKALYEDVRSTAVEHNDNMEVATELSALVSVVGKEERNNIVRESSWPGEIISSGIAQIQPQREGVITEWWVRIGDMVNQGQTVGKISAPPATPELVAMLAEKAEGLARARAAAEAIDIFAQKEQQRFDAMRAAIDGRKVIDEASALTALQRMKDQAVGERDALRSFIERALARHISEVSYVNDWRSFRFGSLNREYGVWNQNVQNAYELSLLTLAQKLKENIVDVPINEAQNYFALFVQLANNSADHALAEQLRMSAPEDQEIFFEMLNAYRMAQAAVADKETDYKLMIKEQEAMIEKERLMAHAEVEAMEASYNTIAKQVNGASYIIAPQGGTVSAIYKKVGELVDPMMSIAMITGEEDIVIRIQIPNNVQRPTSNDEIIVVRPGFSDERKKAKIVGVGTSLDAMGSYMADAIFIDAIDWPIGASVRVLAKHEDTQMIERSSVWSDEQGANYVWGVSEVGRVFAKKVDVGRTMGSFVEVYKGLEKGDQYVTKPNTEIRENILIEDAEETKRNDGKNSIESTKSGGHDSMPGM